MKPSAGLSNLVRLSLSGQDKNPCAQPGAVLAVKVLSAQERFFDPGYPAYREYAATGIFVIGRKSVK
jgi:hypothetical protein